MQLMPGNKTHTTTEKFCFELMQVFLREFMEKREALTWQKGTEVHLPSELSRFPVLFLNEQTHEFLMKSLYFISKYCTQAIEKNAFGMETNAYHWSWVRRVHFPDMPELIVKGITSTSFGHQGNTRTHLLKWSKIHVPPTPSSLSHQSGVRGRSPWEHCKHSLHEGQHRSQAGHLHCKFLTSTSPLCKLCHLNTDLLPWKQWMVQKLFVIV